MHEVAQAVRGLLANTIKDYGLDLRLFNIEAIPIIDDDPKVKKVIEDYQRIMSEDTQEKMRLKRRADNLEVYKVERSFDTSEKVAENMGGGLGEGGNLIGTMIGMGMVNPIANQMGNIMQNNTQATNPINNSQVSNDDIIKLLEQLGKLKALGILTEDEFNDKKKELLTKIK